ncbi:MAG: hypothetical protein HYS17_00870 [Micavibrio aeruginosavorus]|uniref:Uncharacterized protein n=1 Tax=Micavibrio aeruginosavorus TaxID=349221 RepID=A0A7T5R2M3_9BACT|nr:MAG: hypothetical protein HYS17_00870 [Micavibrio aeruginosavorus]
MARTTSKNKQGRKVLPLLIVALALSLLATPANAQSNRSVEELTGFAFFKFAKVQPDFRSWITMSDTYRQATPRERVNMLRNGVTNLENSFNNYVIEDHPIRLKVPAKITLPTQVQLNKMKSAGGSIDIPIKLNNDNGGFFAIQVADMWIALIPEDFENLLTIKVPVENYDAFRKTAIDNGLNSKEGHGLLNLELIPTQADTTSPLLVKDYELWMLMGKVTMFELWSSDEKNMIWYHELPGYKPRIKGESIYNLFKN